MYAKNFLQKTSYPLLIFSQTLFSVYDGNTYDTLDSMALFREHVTVGALVATVGVVVTYYYAFATDWKLLLALFIVTIVASFMPDLDSDTSIPFYIVFGLFTLVCGGLVLFDTLTRGTESMYELAGRPLLATVVVWLIIGGVFKKLTRHRGMMHSLPATVNMALIVYLIAFFWGTNEFEGALLAIGAGVGYLVHLILDELHATVSIDGHLFDVRESLGSALKLFSASRMANIFTYVILVCLIYVAV